MRREDALFASLELDVCPEPDCLDVTASAGAAPEKTLAEEHHPSRPFSVLVPPGPVKPFDRFPLPVDILTRLVRRPDIHLPALRQPKHFTFLRRGDFDNVSTRQRPFDVTLRGEPGSPLEDVAVGVNGDAVGG